MNATHRYISQSTEIVKQSRACCLTLIIHAISFIMPQNLILPTTTKGYIITLHDGIERESGLEGKDLREA